MAKVTKLLRDAPLLYLLDCHVTLHYYTFWRRDTAVSSEASLNQNIKRVIKDREKGKRRKESKSIGGTGNPTF